MEDHNEINAVTGVTERDILIVTEIKEPKKRRSISLGLRFAIFNRDSFRCRYCGATSAQAQLHVDHVVAVANGGENDKNNLVTSCRECNLGKSARTLEKSAPQPPLTVGSIRINPDMRPLERPAPTLYWLGTQWKVTSDGIDTIDDRYLIEAHRIWEEEPCGYGWVQHMREKGWVWMWEFKEALEFARRLFIFGPKQVENGQKSNSTKA